MPAQSIMSTLQSSSDLNNYYWTKLTQLVSTQMQLKEDILIELLILSALSHYFCMSL